MTWTPQRRRAALTVALAFTLLAVFWPDKQSPDDAQDLAVTRTDARVARKANASPPSEAAMTVKLDRLRRPPLPDAPGEDLFKSQSWYVPPAPPKAKPAGPPPPPPRPMAPPLPFTFLGKMVENGEIVVFLSNADRNIVARTGDIIDGVYKVDSITPTSMTMTYLPLNAKQTLPVGESS